MADDPFVVLETTSASDSAYTSPGRSSDPMEDLDKSATSEGKNVNHTDADDSLFENPSDFDQVPGSDPLFTSDINGHTKSNNSNTSSIARDSSPVHRSVNGNSARKSSMEDLGDMMPKSQSARYSDIHDDDIDQSPRSTESEDDIWLTVSEIPLFTQPTSAPPPSRSPPLLKQKPLGANANGKYGHVRRSSQNHSQYADSQMPVYDNNVFDEDFERNSSDREEKDRQERLEQEMRLREQNEREQRILEKKRELEQQRERERQAVDRATKEARDRAAAEARAKAEREASQRAQRAAVHRAQQEARERAAAEAKERAARVAAAEAKERAAAEAKVRAAAEAKERAAAEAKEREKAAARERAAAERAAVERAQQEARKRAERAAVERAAAEARQRQAAAAAAAATREKQNTPDDLESFFGAGVRANSAPKQRDASPTVVSYICRNVNIKLFYLLALCLLLMCDFLGFYVWFWSSN